MKKFDINNITISIAQQDSKGDPNELAKLFQDRLEKVVNQWENHQSIEDLYFEEQEKLIQQNSISTSTEGGAATTSSTSAQSFVASTTPSVARGNTVVPTSISSSTGFSIPTEESNTISYPDFDSYPESESLASAVSETQSTTTRPSFTDSINPYSGISSQQTITIPKGTNENETAGLIQKIKDKRDLAIKNNDTTAVAYWNKLVAKLEEGTSVSALLTDTEITENPLFAEFKSMTQTSNEILSFNWETVRHKMIAAIDSKIINGNRNKASVEYWKAIRTKLSKSDCNVANLFEEYDELFLLLKEVEGLTELPSRITFFTQTKVYPDLSPDKMYANLGIDDIYVFLKENRKTEELGAGVNKGAVYIKNSTANSFITGETLEFALNEDLVNASKKSKENINWVVYLNNKVEKDFVNEGTSFSYNFDKVGKYIIEAYGGKRGAAKKATKKHSAFVEVTIVNQEIEVIAPQTVKGEYARPFTTEKPFVVKLKENKAAKPLQPIALSYQIEYKEKGKTTTTLTDAKLIPNDGVINIAMPQLGTYTLLVKSNDQYAITHKKQWKIIENYVESVEIINNKKPNNVYLHLDTPQEVTFAVKKFKIEPPTPDEVAKVKWVFYNEKELQAFDKDKTKTKQPFAKGTKTVFKLPVKEGNYCVEAYSNNPEANNSVSSQKIQIVTPRVTEASWTDAQGDKKEITGFKGETAFIKASIPNFGNQKVRVFFYVKKAANAAYYAAHEYYSDTTTDANGNINKQIVFNDKMKSEFRLGNGENAFLKIGFIGLIDNKPYPFKEAKYSAKDVELQLTTKRQLLDLYFEYDGRRVMEKDRVPYDVKKLEFINLIAKTRNMAGDSLTFTVHGLGKSNVLGKLGETKVDSNGLAKITISSFLLWNSTSIIALQKNNAQTFYVGIEGFSAKHIKDRTLVLEVGAKWDSASIFDENNPQLLWGDKVSKDFRLKLLKICSDLWGPSRKYEMANAMMICMAVETGETFSSSVIINSRQPISKEKHKANPHLVEGKPVGLAQFTVSAVKSLILNEKNIPETKESAKKITLKEVNEYKQKLALLSPEEQLDYVANYLKLFDNHKKVKRPEDVYMVIFAPSYAGQGDDVDVYKKFLTKEDETKEKVNPNYKENAGMDTKKDGFNNGDNDGIIQAGELLSRYRQYKATGVRYALGYNETRRLNQILAEKIIKEKRISFSTSHESGVIDKAMALDNITDTSLAKKANRSNYENAPGGDVELTCEMLYIMYMLSKDYTFNISEIVGASHTSNSNHYKGIAFDVSEINGLDIGNGVGKNSKPNPDVSDNLIKEFRVKSISYGATKVLNKLTDAKRKHDNHFHVEIVK